MRKMGLKDFQDAVQATAENPGEGVQTPDDVAPAPDTLAGDPLPKTPLTMTLPCRITPQEKAEAAQLMAQSYNDLQDLLGRKKEVVAQYKAEEEAANGEINRQSQKIRNEFEHRPVQCERVIDYGQCEARTYRKDTGEVVNIRDLTPSELQTKMELAAADEGPQEGAPTT